jgi:hypothetical protein
MRLANVEGGDHFAVRDSRGILLAVSHYEPLKNQKANRQDYEQLFL